MLGSIDKTAATGNHRRAIGIFIGRNRKHPGLAAPPTSSYAPHVSATVNCKES
jgi:hypothetical protein